ncbi:MAG: RNA polymerase sigma factor [Puia sp.]|nr:RNA polymerase sigma factor [Puia sp.]
MDTLSDNALMLKVKDGDVEKMGLLFERYHKPLYGFFFHMTRQKETSDDLVQNVFFRMLKYRKNFAGTGQFKTWMYHLARNVLKDQLKKNSRTPVHSDVLNLEEKMESPLLTNTLLEKKQELKTLEMAMSHLSEENRELLILFRFQELSQREIGRILEISEGAVKVRVHRALNQLKTCYLKIAN